MARPTPSLCSTEDQGCVSEPRAYHDRKQAQGKSHNQAVRALGRHMVRVIWAMLRDGRDYEPRGDAA